MARLQVLGAVDLRGADGHELRSVLAQPKRVALLSYLAIEGGYQRRDTLLALLWPESDEERARHSLNQGLYGLRRSLGANAVVSRGPQEVGIDPAEVWCDAAALRQAIADGRPADGLELYRDDLLKGFFLDGAPEFERWLEATRAQLREGAARLAWAAAAETESAGNAAGAAYWGRRAVDLARDDDAAVRAFLELLARTGQAGLALDEFKAHEKRLAEVYELAPDPATRALAERIAASADAAAPRSANGHAGTAGVAPRAAGDPARIGAAAASAGAASNGPAIGTGSTALPGGERPEALTPFVGREAEAARLEAMLDDAAVRLITIAGPAGAGKTRLALYTASRTKDAFPDGSIFVPLTSVAAPDRVPGAIAAALHVERPGAASTGQVLGMLRDRRLLLILDNMDHLVGGAAVVADLLAAAPGVKVLVTSREVLNLGAEWVFPLGGMTWEADAKGEAFPQSDGVRLFVEAAKRADPSFVLGGEERACVREILELVDGLPLGLELAAAWTRALSLDAMVDELRSSRLALANPIRDAPPRHTSLGAAFAHSWEHLGEAERRAWRALSVFRGGFGRVAAERVAGAALDVLRALVDKSLVQRWPGGRYAMLEVIREYAAEKLKEDAAALAAARDRHRDHFAGFLDERLAALRGAPSDATLLELDREADNLREAWRWAAETEHAPALEKSIEPLFIYHDVRGLHDEGAEAFHAAAEVCPATRPALLARLRAREGAFHLRAGRVDEAARRLEQALALAREVGEVSESAFILDRLGVAEYERGRFDAARRFQEESLRLREGVGDRHGIATSLNNLGSLAFATGAYAEARELCGRSLALQQAQGDEVGAILSLHNLGCVELMLGEPGRAAEHLEAALAASRAAGSDALVARSLYHLGNAAHALGWEDEARRSFEAALLTAGRDPTPFTLDILMGLAGVLRSSGSVPHAVEILAFVAAHPAAERHRRHTASELLAELRKTEMPADAFARHSARGRSARLTELPGYRSETL